MKFTVIGHASLYIENHGKSLLIDPWLVGSCYWRSWWNFPEIDSKLISKLNPDYIYLTHLHWDHFHAPSLNLFPKDTTILIPEEPGNRMIRDLNSLGFYNILELKHAKVYDLWNDFKVTSYQFGPFYVDSALLINSENTTLLNANDCKLMGLPLEQIKKHHPTIDFTFRSHSSASPLPYCINNFKEKFKHHRTEHDYIDEFTNFCLSVGTRYAIPFASNHCYLHKDTYQYNELAVSPIQVRKQYNQLCKESNYSSECVVMSSGSSWSNNSNFELKEFDYSNRDKIIAKMVEKYHSKLTDHYKKTSEATAHFDSFKNYFKNFYSKTPKLILNFLPERIIFEILDCNGSNFWLLNIHEKTCSIIDSPMRCNFIIKLDAIVVNDCTRKMMFSSWTPSKRLSIYLDEDNDYKKVTAFFGMLDFFETDGFPLFTARHFRVGIRRWREIITYLNIIYRVKLLKKPISSMMPHSPHPSLIKPQR